jgi:hypothetical protein
MAVEPMLTTQGMNGQTLSFAPNAEWKRDLLLLDTWDERWLFTEMVPRGEQRGPL